MAHRFFSYLIKNQIILALFIIATIWTVIQIKDILLTIFFSYIIVAAILPAVIFLQKKHFPKIFAVLIPYVAVLGAIIILIVPLINFMIGQIQSLIVDFPKYLQQASHTLDLPLDISQLQTYLTTESNSISRNAFSLTTQVFGGFFTVIMILILTFYLLFYYNEFKKGISNFFHPHYRADVLVTIDKINDKLGAWLRGQILLSLFIGVLSWVALVFLGIENAIPLALLSGILEIIPTLGPILSAVPAVIVALTISPQLAITVIIAYILIQFIENNLLVPKVMEKAVGLNPVIVILAVIIGTNLIGFSGALLAIPLLTFILVIFKSIDAKQQ